MFPRLKKSLVIACFAAASTVTTSTAIAYNNSDGWPNRTIQLVVPFPAGSSPDILARTIAEPISQELEQTIIVENKPGAGGNIGTRYVAQAKPNGYTMLLTINGPVVTAPTLYKTSLGYEPLTHLQPISLIGTSPNVLIVPADSPATTFEEFVELAKKQKGALNYGSVGAGSASHLSMAMLECRADIELAHIPYSGFPQIISGMISGDIDATFMVPAIAQPQIDSGKVRALAITSLTPSELLPGLEPIAAQPGFEDFEAISWDALFVPAGTSASIVERLHEVTSEVLTRPEIQEKIRHLYFTPESSTPEDMTEMMKSEKILWDKVIARLGITLE